MNTEAFSRISNLLLNENQIKILMYMSEREGTTQSPKFYNNDSTSYSNYRRGIFFSHQWGQQFIGHCLIPLDPCVHVAILF